MEVSSSRGRWMEARWVMYASRGWTDEHQARQREGRQQVMKRWGGRES